MKIEKSTDWEQVKDELRSVVRGIGYNPDLNRMLKNIDAMVTNLSILEVDARRTRSMSRLQGEVDKVNEAITQVEKWLMIAALMQ
jgi:hypothetical protein